MLIEQRLALIDLIIAEGEYLDKKKMGRLVESVHGRCRVLAARLGRGTLTYLRSGKRAFTDLLQLPRGPGRSSISHRDRSLVSLEPFAKNVSYEQ
jgi:hypothetical protein